MKNDMIRSLALVLALAAAPAFAGLNYNASKSNTGNITVQKTNADGAAKGQATEKTLSAPKSSSATPSSSQPVDSNHGAMAGKRQH